MLTTKYPPILPPLLNKYIVLVVNCYYYSATIYLPNHHYLHTFFLQQMLMIKLCGPDIKIILKNGDKAFIQYSKYKG